MYIKSLEVNCIRDESGVEKLDVWTLSLHVTQGTPIHKVWA